MADTKVRTGQNAIIIFRDSVNRLGTSYAKHAGQPLAGYPLNAGVAMQTTIKSRKISAKGISSIQD